MKLFRKYRIRKLRKLLESYERMRIEYLHDRDHPTIIQHTWLYSADHLIYFYHLEQAIKDIKTKIQELTDS